MSKRKSFVVHIDSLDILDDLTDEQAGQLFKAIHFHHKGEDLELSSLVKIAFSPFKNQFARDADKYEKLCEKNRLIAEKRYNTKSTTGKSGNQSQPSVTKSTDNDSDSDSDSKSDNKKLDFSPLALSDEEIKELKALRSKKKASVTQRVIILLAKEFELSRKRGYSNDDILNEWANRGWTSYKDEWMKGKPSTKPKQPAYPVNKPTDYDLL